MYIHCHRVTLARHAQHDSSRWRASAADGGSSEETALELLHNMAVEAEIKHASCFFICESHFLESC